MEKEAAQEQNLVREFDSSSGEKAPMMKLATLLIIVAVLGFGTGFVIVKGTSKQATSATEVKTSSDLTKGTAVGTNDLSTFKDTVEGTLKKGGIEDEGQFHLVRPGGDSQNVYLTSSSVDLSLMLDRKVKVWGQTQTAQHAGWLMDVGRVEILE